MIPLVPIRTKRLQINLHEITIGDAIYLCNMPPSQQEAGTTKLLQSICDPEVDVLNMTVQERTFIVANYLAQTNGGNPDFPVGEGKFSDYLLDGEDNKSDIELGFYAEDLWFMRPLLGIHAESIERLIISGELEEARHGWWYGAMAATMYRKVKKDKKSDELVEPDPPMNTANDTDLDEYIKNRAKTFMAYPQSVSIELVDAFWGGVNRLNHLFKLSFHDYGLAWLPTKEATGEEPVLPPARFQFSAAINEATQAIFGKYDE